MTARLQISEWLEGDPAGELEAPTPRDESRPAPEPSVSSTPVDLATLRRHLTTGRELVRSRAASDRPPPLATALPALDRLLGGGLVRGELVELAGGPSSGRFSLVLAVLGAVTGAGEAAALIDLGDGLHPADADAAGIDLERLLWLRPRSVREALAGAEMLVTGGFPLVAVDLGVPPVPGGRGASGAWVRLARTAERHGTALLVSAPEAIGRVSGAGASTVLTSRGRGLMGGTAPGGRERRALLLGLETEMQLDKARARPPGLRERLRLATPEAVRHHTLPGDAPSRPEGDRTPARRPHPLRPLRIARSA